MADTKHADLATKSKDLRVQLVDSIISMMEDNDRLFWTDGLSPSAFTPVNGTSNRPYNGFNRIMLALEANSKGYQDPRWCTYRQASKKGWQVKRGEHGSKIEFWKTYRIPLDAEPRQVGQGPRFRPLQPVHPEAVRVVHGIQLLADRRTGTLFSASRPTRIRCRQGFESLVAVPHPPERG